MNKVNISHNPERYENIFNLYEYDGEIPYTFYNILNTVKFPDNISDTILNEYKVEYEMPWTTISYKIYETQHLWWLLCLLNGIKDPTKLLRAGSVIYAIKPNYLDGIYKNLQTRI